MTNIATWYIALDTGALPKLFKNDLGFTWTFLRHSHFCFSVIFVLANTRAFDPWIFKDSGLKFYIYIHNHLNEICEYKRSPGHSLTVDPALSYFDNLKQLLKNQWANCNPEISYRYSRGLRKENLFKRFRSHGQYGRFVL